MRIERLTAQTVEFFMNHVFLAMATLARHLDAFASLVQGCDCAYGATYRAVGLAVSSFLYSYRKKLQDISKECIKSPRMFPTRLSIHR
jgi:hypothetical protein